MVQADPQAAPRPGFLRRVGDILVSRKSAWAAIAAEPDTVKGLYLRYLCPLAAVWPVLEAVGAQLFGSTFLGVVYRPPVLMVLANLVGQYLFILAFTLVFALIVDALAPFFGGVRNRVQAMKLVVYSATPALLAAPLHAFGPASWLSALSLYSLYLFYKGLPVLMGTRGDRALVYFTVSVVCGLVLVMLAGSLLTLLTLGRALGGVA